MAGSAFLMARVLPSPTARLPGSELVGIYSHVWKYWWTARAILQEGTSPIHTDLLASPVGLPVGYFMASFMDATLMLPVTASLGPVAAVNAFVILTLVTSCWAATWVAGELGLGRGASLLVGVAWTFAPHYHGFLMGGAVEFLPSPFLPLYLYALWRMLVTPPGAWGGSCWGLGALAAGSLYLLSLTAWGTGLLAAAAGGLAVLVAMALRPHDLVRGASWALGAIAVGSLLTALSTFALIPKVELLPEGLSLTAVEPSQLFRLGVRSVPERELYCSSMLWMNHHLSLVLVALAALGGFSRRGRIWAGICLSLLAVELVIGLVAGHLPHMQVTPTLETVVRILGSGDRRLALLHLPLALAAGEGLQQLQARIGRRGRSPLVRLLPPVAIVAWLCEILLLSPVALPAPAFEARQAPHAEWLARYGQGGVVDVPLILQGDLSREQVKARRSLYLVDQTFHGLPVLTAVGTKLDYYWLPVEDPLLEALSAFQPDVSAETCLQDPWTARPGPRPVVPLDDEFWRTWNPGGFFQHGYKHLVVHGDLMDPAELDRLRRSLDGQIGPPLEFPGPTLVYTIVR